MKWVPNRKGTPTGDNPPSMHLFMSLSTHMHMYMYVHACIRICICICICVKAYGICMHVYVCLCISLSICVYSPYTVFRKSQRELPETLKFPTQEASNGFVFGTTEGLAYTVSQGTHTQTPKHGLVFEPRPKLPHAVTVTHSGARTPSSPCSPSTPTSLHLLRPPPLPHLTP